MTVKPSLKPDETPRYSPVCMFCKHLRSGLEQTCDAFPDGIPEDIWLGRNKHRKPVVGDHGIQFEKLEL